MAEANLAVIITGRGKDLINEFRKVGKEAESSGSRTHAGWQKASQGIKVAGAAIAGTAIAVGVASVHMANDYEKSHARLVVALDKAGEGWKGTSSAIEEAVRQGTKFGYTATDIEGALAQMETSTGSMYTSLKLLGIAQDLAAYKNISLADASLVVTKAFQGQLKPLKALAIDLPVAAGGALKVKRAEDAVAKAMTALSVVQTKVHMGLLKGPAAVFAMTNANAKLKDAQDKLSSTQATGTTILDALSKKMGGQASEQAKTFEGRTKAMKAELGNLGIKIGLFLMPILMKLVDIVQTKLVPWFEKHSGVGKALAIVLGVTLVAAAVLYTAHMIAAAAATIAATWPVIAIIAVVALLVLGARKLGITWDNVWRGMQIWAQKPVIKQGVQLIQDAISGVIWVVTWLRDNWSGIWTGMQNVVISVANGIGGAINQIIRVVNDLIQGINDATLGFADIPKIPTFGSIAHPEPPAPVHHAPMGPFTGGVYGTDQAGYGPSLPRTATGGIAMRPQVRLVGEAGPEAIIPLSRAGAMGGTTTIVNVTVNGIVSGHAHEVGKYISDHLIKYERKSGKRWIATVTP